jgi:hypothetical protein
MVRDAPPRGAPHHEVARWSKDSAYARFNRSICGRSPLAFAVIGGRGIFAMPGSISNV